MLIRFSFVNQYNPLEEDLLYIFNPLERRDYTMGLLCGISSADLMPCAYKCMVTLKPQEHSESFRSQLLFTKKDLKRLEQLNNFGIDIVADNPVRRDVDSHVGTAGKQVHKGRNLLGKQGQDLRQQLIFSTDVIQGALQVFFGSHRLIAQGIGPDLIHLGMAHLFTDVIYSFKLLSSLGILLLYFL